MGFFIAAANIEAPVYRIRYIVVDERNKVVVKGIP
jgi:hypothetical protein